MPAKKEPHTAFGKRLFALRKAQGLTQVQLADALGTTQRVNSYYETDAELPPAAAIVPLARLLEVSSDQLLGLEPAAPRGRQQPQRQRLWKRFQKMDALPTKNQRASKAHQLTRGTKPRPGRGQLAGGVSPYSRCRRQRSF